MFTSKTRSFSGLRGAFDGLKRHHVGQLIALLGVVALFVPPAAADTLEEVHLFNLGIDAPTPDSVSQYSFDLPLFDTAGGARQLVGFRVVYNQYSAFTYAVNANPTADWHGCELKWQTTWNGTLNGAQWFPMNQSSGNLNAGGGVGVIQGPFTSAVPPFSTGSGVGYAENFDDPNLLATLTGVGTIPVECTHALSAIVAAPPPDRFWPPQAPLNQRIFDPNLIDLTVDRIGMDVTVTYFWNAVPEPTGFVLLGLGAVTLLRRR